LETWYEAWGLARHATDPHGRAVADFAIAEWLLLSASFGHIDGVNRVLKEVDGRDIAGTAGVKIQRARETLGLVLRVRESAVPCAAEALLTLFDAVGRSAPAAVSAYRSSSAGTSLAELRDLSGQAGLALRVVEPMRIGEIPMPSIVHLKVGHYATITARDGDAYRIEDRGRSVSYWIHRDTLFGESSGYFLLRAEEPLGTNWRVVDDDTAATVRGWSVDCPPGSPPPSPPCDECHSDDSNGMPVYRLQAVTASLILEDTPVAYGTPRGPALPLTLSYHHREALQPQVFTSSNLGPKWTFGWLRFVQEVPAGALGTMAAHTWVYQPPGGREVYTTPDANGVYPAHWASRAVLVRVSASPLRYERRLPDGTVEVYAFADGAPAGQQRAYLTELIDALGQRLQFTWDAQFRLVAIGDAIGQVTTVQYALTSDPLKITTITDPFNRTATFTYNDAGQLASITDVLGLTSKFGYGPNDFVTTLTTPYGVTSFRHEPNEATTLSYRHIEATDPLGGTERVEFQWQTPSLPATLPAGDVPTGFEAWNDNLDHYNTFRWSKRAWMLAKGDLTKAEITHWLTRADFYGDSEWSVIAHSVKKPLEARTWYAYPGQTAATARSLGWLRKLSRIGRVLDDGSSQISETTYNSQGSVLTRTDPLGRQTTYTYGADGVTLTQVKQTGNGANDVLATYSNFTALKQPQTITDAAGQSTTVTYTSAGQVLTTTNAKQETTTYTYDSTGRLLTTTAPVAGAVTTNTYDAYGRLRTVTDADNHTVTMDYDVFGRPTRTTYPNGTYEETTYDRLDVATRRDRAGRLTRYYYDALRRLTATRDPAGRVVTQEWCGCGALDALIDANGNRTRWERDLQGRVTREVRADNVTATVYTYEPKSGRLVTVTDPKQQVTTYSYARDNAVLSTVYTNAAIGTPSVSFTYDTTYGRVATMSDGVGLTSYTYHPVGGLAAGRVASADGPLTDDTITYSYDELGRVTSRAINGTANTVTWSFDALGRVTSEVNLLGTFSYTYDGTTSRLATVTYPNSQTSTYSYFDNETDRRLQTIHHKYPNGTTLSRFDYTYDAVGNIVTWRQQADTTAVLWDYGYDAADQLVAAVKRATDPQATVLQRFAYGYDPAGNRTVEQIDDQVTGATYDALNRLVSQQPSGVLELAGTVDEPATVTVQGLPAITTGTDFRGAVPIASGTNTLTVTATDPSGNTATRQYEVDSQGTSKIFSFDANGNLTSDGTRTFEWDARNQLVAIQVGLNRVEFVYNGTQRAIHRIRRDNGVAVSAQNVVWCDADICEERQDGSTSIRRIVDRGDVTDGVFQFYTRDHLQNVRSVSTAATLVSTYSYDPWGRRTVSGGSPLSGGFASMHLLDVGALWMTIYRFYDPELGRWLSEDPLLSLVRQPGPAFLRRQLVFSSALSLRAYTYVENSPVLFTDPSGLAPSNCGNDSPRCNSTYGPCDAYSGANARCFCKCTGNDAWSKMVRCCLFDRYSSWGNGFVGRNLAHGVCYDIATGVFGVHQIPVTDLFLCWHECNSYQEGVCCS
jgi:RHS repeat-associated protein